MYLPVSKSLKRLCAYLLSKTRLLCITKCRPYRNSVVLCIVSNLIRQNWMKSSPH